MQLTEQQKQILLYLSLGCIIIVLLVFFFSSHPALSSKIKRHTGLALPLTGPRGLNVLIVGVDNDVDELHRRRSDTIILANINTQKHKISLISIPRDSRVYVPGYGYNKINHAYYYGGIKLLRRTVSGFLHVDIPYYIIIDPAGVRNIIDSVGGVKINVEERMYYVDHSGGLYINLKPGLQTLDGKHAEQYIRFRKDSKADIGRTIRQQKVIKAISSKLKGPTLIWEAPRLIITMMRFTESNIPWRYYYAFAKEFKAAYDANSLTSTTIPSEAIWIDAVSFQQPNAQETAAIVQQAVYGKPLTFKKPINPLKKTNTLTVELLIGNGSAASLSKVLSKLSTAGYKLGESRYAGRQDYTETMLVNWHGEQTKRESTALAKLLGINSKNIVQYNNTQKPVCFSVVIGNDRK